MATELFVSSMGINDVCSFRNRSKAALRSQGIDAEQRLLERAMAALNQTDLVKSERLFCLLLDGGYMEAHYWLSRIYQLSLAVVSADSYISRAAGTRDILKQKHRFHFYEAARAGHEISSFALGFNYFENRKYPLARSFFRKAEIKGSCLSRVYLAYMLFYGIGGNGSHSEARRLILQCGKMTESDEILLANYGFPDELGMQELLRLISA